MYAGCRELLSCLLTAQPLLQLLWGEGDIGAGQGNEQKGLKAKVIHVASLQQLLPLVGAEVSCSAVRTAHKDTTHTVKSLETP